MAQEKQVPAKGAVAPEATVSKIAREIDPGERLALQQQQLAAKYQRFEEVLLRVAELAASEDPDRAALLRRTVARSKEDMIGLQLGELVELLKSNRLAKAVKNQDALHNDLARLLELLLSEDRHKKLDERKARVKEWIKQVNKLIKQQRAVQGSTESGGDTTRNADLQAKLADRTGDLSGEMRSANEEAKQAEGETGEGEKSSAEGEPSEPEGDDAKKPTGDGKSSDASGDGEKKSDTGDSESSDAGDASKKGSPSPGQSGGQPSPGGDSQDQQDSRPSDPVQQRLEAARQQMRKAQDRLEKALREEAVEEQEAALLALEQAKAELEKILRQLREEEIKRMLGALESRFREMLDLQMAIHEDTIRLDNVPRDQWRRDEEIQAGRLGSREFEIVTDADKTLALLRDDGTAVALPEAIRQMREDMRQVGTRLAETKVAEITQGIEEDIITALEEIIAALEKAQQDLESKQQQPPRQGQPSDPPLVDQLAELKMIRALQMRVNRRTVRFSRIVDGEGAASPDLLEALEELSERERRIYRVTHDIVVGRPEGS